MCPVVILGIGKGGNGAINALALVLLVCAHGRYVLRRLTFVIIWATLFFKVQTLGANIWAWTR